MTVTEITGNYKYIIYSQFSSSWISLFKWNSIVSISNESTSISLCVASEKKLVIFSYIKVIFLDKLELCTSVLLALL